MTPRTSLPTTFAAGTTVSVRLAGPLTANDGTVVTVAAGYRLLWVLRGHESVDVESVADGDGWLLTLSAIDSADLVAGTYRAALLAERDTGPDLERHEIGAACRVAVTPDLVAAIGGDLEDPDERALRLLIAARDNTLTQGFQSIMVDGKQLQHYSLDQLERAIAKYEGKIGRKQGGRVSGSIGTVFVRR